MAKAEQSKATAAKRARGIMCLEGEWESELTDRKTVQPLVEYVTSISGVPHVHRRVQNRDGALELVRRWCHERRLRRYEILYLAAHGWPGGLELGDASNPETAVGFDDLAKAIGDKGSDRILYLGSCSAARDFDAIRALVRSTGLKAVVGYTKNVDFVTGSAVDLIALDALSRYSRPGDALNYVERQIPDLVETLGFVVLRAHSKP